MGMAEKAGLRRHLSNRQREAVTAASHLGYGATVGVPYALLHRHIPLPPAATGAAWGLAVWAASYAGWLPAAGILPPPNRRPAHRNRLLVETHLLWGALLGLLTKLLTTEPRHDPRRQPRHRPIRLRPHDPALARRPTP